MQILDPNTIDLVLYHANCRDGFGAAYSAWKCLGSKAEYVPCNHGTNPPGVKGKVVAILDFSYDNKTIRNMIADAKELIVIDHHKSAMIELHNIPNTHFDMNHSGARLAWDYFHPGKEPPKFINYIEDCDLWAWKLPYSKEFNAAFDMVPFEFEEYEKFEDDSVFDDAVKRGSYILAYSKTVIKKICDEASPRKFNGKNVLVVNSSHWISEVGASLSPKCDFALIWFFDHESQKVRVSLRSFHENIDVSEVAKEFGGGGHKKAAGFELPADMHIEDLFQVEIEMCPDDASGIPHMIPSTEDVTDINKKI
jgi:oligoribonuclease NrnB/cAMP/cGMP phosphodiesterase (DHH superfamily)